MPPLRLMEEYLISYPAILPANTSLKTMTPITTQPRILCSAITPSHPPPLSIPVVAQNSCVRMSLHERNSALNFNGERQCVRQPRHNLLHPGRTWDTALVLPDH